MRNETANENGSNGNDGIEIRMPKADDLRGIVTLVRACEPYLVELIEEGCDEELYVMTPVASARAEFSNEVANVL
jgi:hypothetical protein